MPARRQPMGGRPSSTGSASEEFRLERNHRDGRYTMRRPDRTLAAKREVQRLTVPFADDTVDRLIESHRLGTSKVYSALRAVKKDLGNFFPTVGAALPETLRGQLVNANGTLAHGVHVTALEPIYEPGELPDKTKRVPWPKPSTLTDSRGRFHLGLPPAPVPGNGLVLEVRGASTSANVKVRRIDLETGKLGMLELDVTLSPAHDTLVGRLADLIPATGEEVDESPEEFASPQPTMILGEDDCARAFHTNDGVIDRFRYSTLVRLVEPRLGAPQTVFQLITGGRTALLPNPLVSLGGNANLFNKFVNAFGASGSFTFRERTAIDRPVDVSGFYDDLVERPLSVPKAGSLGFGYIVDYRQVWIPAGLSLGDLVYSLPLAPGEEQRIVVVEQSESLEVRESESFDLSEAQSFNEAIDTSTSAVFESALRESGSGGTHIDSTSHAWGVGAAGGVGGFVKVLFGVGVAGGYGGSTTSGNTSSWQNASRDFSSSASQELHAAIARNAAARRRAARTGVRLARSRDRESFTTKILANRNHCHALTVQYWEVLRHFSVRSTVDDVQLVCFVPLELVAFRPADVPLELPRGILTRDDLLSRYRVLAQYYDVLRRRVPRRSNLRTGLRALGRLVADPTMQVQPASGPEQDVIQVSLEGTFLQNEELTVTVHTRRRATLGPFELTVQSGEQPELNVPVSSLAGFIEGLRQYREGSAGVVLRTNIALPATVARNEVQRIEIKRRTRRLSLTVESQNASDLDRTASVDVSIEPDDLEREIGLPRVWDVDARLSASGETYVAAYQGRESAVVMGVELELGVLRLPPVLSYSDLLRIESLLRHVLRNEVAYSKAVWMSITPEERAMLLERFTIGLPSDGVDDTTQQIPLLRCVANQVLGFFGNAMVMPFHIPAGLAESEGVTTREIQEALLRFHRQAFSPARTSITLPSRGVLGEAVLGHCNACEKIDLTRFWNWQDSPGLSADDPASLLPKGSSASLAASARAGPSQLVPEAAEKLGAVNLIGNLTTAKEEGRAAPTPDLVNALLKAGVPDTSSLDLAGQKEADAVFKKLSQVSSEARSESLSHAKALANKALTDLSKFISLDRELTKKAASDQAGKVKGLAENVPAIAALLGQGSDAEATGRTKDEVEKLLGDSFELTLDEKKSLFDALKAEDGDSAEVARGKKALLEALGLTE